MPVMFGNGPITLPSLQTPIRCFIVSDSRATPSSTSKVSRSEVPRVIFFEEDMVCAFLFLFSESFDQNNIGRDCKNPNPEYAEARFTNMTFEHVRTSTSLISVWELDSDSDFT